jgi:hypothetical protein
MFNSDIYAQNDRVITEESEDHSTQVHQEMNHLAAFVGGTAMLENKGSYFTLGLDYMRLLSVSRDWAVGGFAEVIFAKHPEWQFGALIYYRLAGQFFIRTGPGIEILRYEEIDPECNCVHVNSEIEFLYRIGIGYAYHKDSLVLTPTVDLDLVRSATALVFGVNIGFVF